MTLPQAASTLHKLIVDQETNNETEVKYCPIGNTTTELFIKLLQCSQFSRLWDIIMNLQNGTSMPPVVRMLHMTLLRKFNRNMTKGNIGANWCRGKDNNVWEERCIRSIGSVLTTLVNVAYSPSMKFSLLSLSNPMKDGWKMSEKKLGYTCRIMGNV